jgi:hypothetical protein
VDLLNRAGYSVNFEIIVYTRRQLSRPSRIATII